VRRKSRRGTDSVIRSELIVTLVGESRGAKLSTRGGNQKVPGRKCNCWAVGQGRPRVLRRYHISLAGGGGKMEERCGGEEVNVT